MAKFLKHLGLGRKPPLPPTKDYENEQLAKSAQSSSKRAHFQEDCLIDSSSKPMLHQDYTNPLDFLNEVACPNEDNEGIYMVPTEENVYSEPYESDLQSNHNKRQSVATQPSEEFYDEVANGFEDNNRVDETLRALETVHLPESETSLLTSLVEYDEPWEWGSGDPVVPTTTAGLDCRPDRHPPCRPAISPMSSASSPCTSIYPRTLNYDGSSSGNLLDSSASSLSFEFCEDSDMPIRHIYETAFDSKVKRDTEPDLDRLTQSPILHGESSSSTSSPGSTGGRETRVKTTHHHHGGAKLRSGSQNNAKTTDNGHPQNRHYRHKTTNGERSSPGSRSAPTGAEEELVNRVSNDPQSAPELPRPKLLSNANVRDIRPCVQQIKSERRKPAHLPNRPVPPKPTSAPFQSVKIKALIESVPVAARPHSSSSSSSSSLDERTSRHIPITVGEPIIRVKENSPTKSLLTNGLPLVANAKTVHAAIADELTSVLKNKFKTAFDSSEQVTASVETILKTCPVPSEPTQTNLNLPKLGFSSNLNKFDNHSNLNDVKAKFEAIRNGSSTNGVPGLDFNQLKSMRNSTSVGSFIMPNAPFFHDNDDVSVPFNSAKLSRLSRSASSNEICPRCCQPILVGGETPQRKVLDLKSVDEMSTSFMEKKTNHIPAMSLLLCKCSNAAALQSPENDTRPLAEYDMPWDVPKRFSKQPSLPNSLEDTKVNNGDSLQLKEVNRIDCSPETSNRASQPLSDPDGERNSAPATLSPHSVEADLAKNNFDVETIAKSVSKSTSEAQIAQKDPILESFTKFKIPAGSGVRKNLNLNFNTTGPSIVAGPKSARQGLALNFGCAALSAKGEMVDPNMPLEEQGWYHGSISRIDAENSLRILKEGSYLVRNSESSKQDYSLSLKSARGFMHMKIVHSEGHYILGQFSKPFASIPEMIHHYSNNKLPIRGAEHMSLLFPVIGQLL